MKRHNRGFSLLEVLVAFFIMTLVLGVAMQIFSGGLHNVGRVGDHQQAMLLGQSKLASLGVETVLREGDSAGEFDPNYRWQLRVSPYLEQRLEQGGEPSAVLPVRLLQLDLKVLWGASDAAHSVSLKTLRVVDRVTP